MELKEEVLGSNLDKRAITAHPRIAPQGKRPIHDYEPAQISNPPMEDNLRREQIRAKKK